jgi:drug/metabolite transporter (DMT)-like permease
MTAERRTRLDTRALALVVLCCVLWGVNQVAAKVALIEIPPLLQGAVRSAGAALLLLAWAKWRGLTWWQRDGTARAGALAGVLFAAEFACIFVGLQYTGASRMVVFIYLAPFMVALGMPLITRSERLSPPQAAGLLLAFAAVVFALYESLVAAPLGPQQWIGDALGVLAALFWGATTLVLRGSRLLDQLVVSAAAMGAASWWAGEAVPATLSALSLALLGFQTVVVTFASYLIWFWLVRHYPATQVAAYTLLTPIFGLAAGVLLLGEPLTVRIGLALAGVALGLWLVQRTPTAPAAAPQRDGMG